MKLSFSEEWKMRWDKDPNIKLQFLIFPTGRYHYASCYYDSGIYQALYHPGDINLDGAKVSAGPFAIKNEMTKMDPR